jgi:hypothetical protein
MMVVRLHLIMVAVIMLLHRTMVVDIMHRNIEVITALGLMHMAVAGDTDITEAADTVHVVAVMHAAVAMNMVAVMHAVVGMDMVAAVVAGDTANISAYF